MRAPRLCWETTLAEQRLVDAVLFGLRVAASAMLALFVAFRLQLDDPGWAATSAVIVAQPVLGATLRKGVLRLCGTFIGACAAVVLFACFPQDRVGFLLALAAWGGVCSAIAILLGELLAYAPLLAGYTCAIVAMGAVAHPPDVFLLAVGRGAGIALGIIATSLVFALTDLGRQRGILARSIEAASGQAMAGLRGALRGPAPDIEAGQAARRPLVARVASFDAVVDQASGENLDLRSRAGVLRRAIAGLLVILSSWRGVEQHRHRGTGAGATASEVEALMSSELATAQAQPRKLRDAACRLLDRPVATASERLLLDRAAHGLEGLADVETGLRLLRAPLGEPPREGLRPTRLRNKLGAAVAGLRSFVAVAGAGAIWVVTGWDAGPTFVIFAMVVVVLFAIRDDAAFSGAVMMATSCLVALALAAAIRFAVMPFAQGQGFEGFLSLCAILGIPLACMGVIAMSLPPGRPASGLAFMSLANFMPLLAPTNAITYDLGGFLDSGLAILAGATLGAAAHRLLPPLPHAIRSWLLLRATRTDLARIARGAWRPEIVAWEARQYARLVGLPSDASLIDHARLLAALSVGRELLRDGAGDGAVPRDQFRAEASRVEIAEAVASHPDFFRGLGLAPVPATAPRGVAEVAR